MSELGASIYTVLLGWMRAVNDWCWSLLRGGGDTLYTLVLSRWKTWLVALVAIGLVADWLVWLVRWRPLRLLFGKRVPVDTPQAPPDDAWDDDEGPYYGPDDDADLDAASSVEKADWTDTTLRTLSEIDPDWADNLTLDAPEVLETDPPPETPRERVYDPWAQTPDEWDGDEEDAPYDEDAAPYDEDDTPYAREYDPEFDGVSEPPEPDPPPKPAPALQTANDQSPNETRVFGRPGSLWPGEFYDRPAPEPERREETSDSQSLRRRRRSIHENRNESLTRTSYASPAASGYEPAFPPRHSAPAPRPARLVTPAAEAAPPPSLTAAPVKRRRLINLSAEDDDAIPGLPPMPVGDAFHAAAMPDGTRRADKDA